MLYYRVKWIVMNRNELDCNYFLEFFSDLRVLISNEIYYICASVKTDSFSIRQGDLQLKCYHFVKQVTSQNISVYRYSLETDLIVELFGYWRHGVIKKLQSTSISAVRRQNMNHFKLRASMVVTQNDTLNHLEDYRDKHIDSITKHNYFLTKYFVQSFNATVQFSYVNSWGYFNSTTGRFSGMIGELQSDTADLGGTALFFTADRIKQIDYLSMTTKTRIKFIFRSPKLSITDNVFLLPFNGSVWLCIISFIILSAILLLIIMLVEFRYTTVCYPGDFRPNLLDTIMNMFGASCQQGSYLDPKSLPARCLILLSLIILMFLYASYSANIVALLQSPSSKIRTLQDLLNSALGVGAQDIVYNKYYITHETEPIRKAIYERKMKNHNGFIPLDEGIKKIREGLYAFHVELAVGYKVISETFQEDEKCGLQEIAYLNVLDPYYAVQKNSSFREIVRLALFKLREFGIQDREHAMIYTKKPKCTGGSSFIPVSIIDVWPALLLLGWGFGFSAGCFLVEKVLTLVRKRNRIMDTSAVFFKRSMK
ncbi:glutamate receptor ionotropic, kainate glr-3-like [Topomyia yanbarensis]|uniref:glutamate receptor ionotropic, kainate glr-3-like n=1 Tax=Topomyia yanbarensis TaxID=2498891 RepID=UPI00273C0544|nr:glutamate receptor ionotropic, kainate glr-3-like [Topomyia yanbarensis]